MNTGSRRATFDFLGELSTERHVAGKSRFSWITIALIVLLLASNGWWLYASMDTAATLSYRNGELADYDVSLSQSQKLLPIAFEAKDRDSFLIAARRALKDEGFEKDGCIWIGRLGFRFDEGSRLVHVARSWNEGEPDPCFPTDGPGPG